MLISEERGEFALAHQQHSRLIRAKSVQVALPEAKRCWTATAVLWQSTGVQKARLPRSVKGTFSKWVPHGEQRISNHKEPPSKTQADPQGKKEKKEVTRSTCLFSSNIPLWANSAQCSPGAVKCLAGLILLSFALILVVSSLVFSSLSHYLPYFESRSDTEVFSFPLRLFLGHRLAARQNYQSLLLEALLRAGNPETLKVGRFKVHWQNSISPACIILGSSQCYQSLAKKE